MALRLLDFWTHSARRQSSPSVTTTGRKDSRALALDSSQRTGTYGYALNSPKLRDYDSYLKSYQRIPWVRACVQVISYNAANINFRLVRPAPGGNGDGEEDEEVLDSPFLNLLNHPNPYQTGFALREALWTDLELTGNAYIELSAQTPRGLPTEMYRLNPSRVTVLPDRRTFIRGYRYTVNGRAVEPDYEPDEIIHMKYANPTDDFYGMGVIESGEARFESEMAMAEHERRFWQSGAKITGILSSDESMDQSTFDRIKDSIRSFFMGSGYSTLLLESGLKYQSVSDGPAKLGMLDMALASRDQILAMFGVPATKVGILERANYKADEADRYFWSETVAPKLTRVEDSLQPLVDLFHPNQGYKLRFKRLNFSDDLPQMQVAKTMADVGVFTADEIRQYTGHDPLPEHGDTLIAQVGIVPLDLGGPMSTINERRADQGLPPLEGGEETLILPRGAVPLNVATGEVLPKPGTTPPGSPPANGSMQPPAALPVNLPAPLQLPPSPIAAAAGKSTRVSLLHPATSHLIRQHQERVLAQADTYVPSLQRFFGEQKARVLDRLASVPRKQKAALATGDWWNSGEEDALLTDALDPLWTTALEAGVAAARSVGVPVKGETPARMERLKQGRAARVTAINETTRAAIADQVSEGLRRGYSSAQIAAGVSDEDYAGVTGVFAQAEGYRASMIGRTEMQSAYNAANLDVYRESGVVDQVELADGDYDETGAARDGQVVSLDEAEGIDEHPNGSLALIPIVGVGGGDSGLTE